MGVIVKLGSRIVRRPPPRKWAPEMLKHLHPEFDGEPAEPFQLRLLLESRTRNRQARDAPEPRTPL